MYTAIIVEDEYKIYQLISHIIDWDSLGIELIDYCPNGVRGLESIKEKTPDIVITDMKMPGLTGVELISEARSQGFQCEFVVISGYKEFEFARGAMIHGVTEYLLKPVNQKEVNEVLLRITERLNQKSLDSEAASTNSETKELLSQSFVQLALNDGIRTDSLDEINQQFSLNLKPDAFRACNLIMFSYGTDDEKGLLEYIKGSFASLEEHYENMLFFKKRDSNILILLNYDPSVLDGKSIESDFSSLLKAADLPYPYVLGIGDEVMDLSSIIQSFNTAEIATYGRFQETTQHVFLFGDVKTDSNSYEDIASNQELRMLRERLEMLDADQATALFDAIISRVKSTTSPEHIWRFFDYIINNVYAVLEKNVDKKIATQSKLDMELKVSTSHTLWQAALPMRGWIISSLQQCAENKTGSNYIRAAKAYIQDHYTESLSLEILADYINLNASYLSVLFKKELNVNFSDYLADVRIEAAKELLRNTNDNIADICTAVGYLDSRHFSKVFTKRVGVKPSDYRRMMK